MFSIAILIGIYSYSIFSLGLLGLFYKGWVLGFTIIFTLVVLYAYRVKILSLRLSTIKEIPGVLLIFLLTQALINLIGALGPELGFDALWYHLTLPKIFLEKHMITHIPGGLLYYSDMPKLIEMTYISSLSFFDEILAKIIHFSFGILVLVAIYKISRKFLNSKFSILASIIFYGNLVVGWQSTTAYVDLARTFFEIMALWGFVNFTKSKDRLEKKGWFIESAVMLGLAISTKLLSLGTLFVFLFLILCFRGFNKDNIKNSIIYLCISLYVAIPWFLFSYLNTGNPIYPIFSDYIKTGLDTNPFLALKSLWNLFTHSADPVSPVYLVFMPLILIYAKKFSPQMQIIAFYILLSLIVWSFTPVKDSRYILPALAALSVLNCYVIQMISKYRFFKNLSLIIVIFVGTISIFYRGIANSKYIPVIIGKESKTHFLSNHLNFSYGDFYDMGGYFKNTITSSDRVLLYGFHNLYYVDFPFIDSSYVKRGDVFNYIAAQNTKLPERFKSWNLIYSNPKTHVNLYSSGGQKWVY